MRGGVPSPEQYNGGEPLCITILDGLNVARGTAYSTEYGTVVYAENEGYARAIAGCWGTNQRTSNQFDPARVTFSLSRWEKILGIPNDYGANDNERRAKIAEKFSRWGQPCTRQYLNDKLDAHVTFVTLHASDSAPTTRFAKLYPGTGYTLPELVQEANQILEFARDLLPAWLSFDWYLGDDATDSEDLGFLLATDNQLNYRVPA